MEIKALLGPWEHGISWWPTGICSSSQTNSTE